MYKELKPLTITTAQILKKAVPIPTTLATNRINVSGNIFCICLVLNYFYLYQSIEILGAIVLSFRQCCCFPKIIMIFLLQIHKTKLVSIFQDILYTLIYFYTRTFYRNVVTLVYMSVHSSVCNVVLSQTALTYYKPAN